MTPTTVFGVPVPNVGIPASNSAAHPVAFSDDETRRLDCLIARIRAGQVNDIVMRHLEVDGVLQLDPLFGASGCEANAN